MSVERQLKSRADFAEYAEAAGVPTSQVIALHAHGETLAMVYTPEPLPDDDPDGCDTTAWVVRFTRDGDGIVRAARVPEPSPFSVHDVCAALMHGVHVAGALSWLDATEGDDDA